MCVGAMPAPLPGLSDVQGAAAAAGGRDGVWKYLVASGCVWLPGCACCSLARFELTRSIDPHLHPNSSPQFISRTPPSRQQRIAFKVSSSGLQRGKQQRHPRAIETGVCVMQLAAMNPAKRALSLKGASEDGKVDLATVAKDAKDAKDLLSALQVRRTAHHSNSIALAR